jgi:8-oxo-dGTP pyrophosphatase MutT (NUDIX family)
MVTSIMTEIECVTLSGERRKFPRERLILRPAAYALIVHEGKILLLKMRATGKYHLPGGGIHPGECIRETLEREAGEETGIEIEVGPFLHFEEVFFYYDPSDRAYHGLHFYYACQPKTFDLLSDNQVNDESAGQPGWVEVAGLRSEEFQLNGEMILEMCIISGSNR